MRKTGKYVKCGKRYVEMMDPITFYAKGTNGRYYPEGMYSSEVCDRFPMGAHVVVVEPGHTIRRYGIEPEYAGLLAAAEAMREAMAEAMHKASKMRPQVKGEWTPVQRKAWQAFLDTLPGHETSVVGEFSAFWDIVDAGIEALVEKAKGNNNDPEVV